MIISVFDNQVIAGMSELLRSGKVHELVVELTPNYWPLYGFTRVQVAQVIVESLWDAGFQNASALGVLDKNEPDVVFADRTHLFNFVSRDQAYPMDFLFVNINPHR